MTPSARRATQEAVVLAVVIPMLNERVVVEQCVERVTLALSSLVPSGILVVVDDGSTDGTGMLLDNLRPKYVGLQVVHHSHNLGYGAALKSGAEVATSLGANWVLFMDSDLTNPPADILRFAEAAAGPVDYVKASRYTAGGLVRGVPFGRRMISRTGNLFSRLLLGLPLSDLTNGFRAIRAESFVQMPLRERGFPVIMEEAYWVRRMGLRVTEIPTLLTNREDQLRPSSFRYRPSVFYAYARYPLAAFTGRVLGRVHRGANRYGGEK